VLLYKSCSPLPAYTPSKPKPSAAPSPSVSTSSALPLPSSSDVDPVKIAERRRWEHKARADKAYLDFCNSPDYDPYTTDCAEAYRMCESSDDEREVDYDGFL
jgi:hypothetical protein